MGRGGPGDGQAPCNPQEEEQNGEKHPSQCGLGEGPPAAVQTAYRFGPLRLQGRLPSTITLEELSSW